MAGLGALGASGLFAGKSLAVLGAGLLTGALTGGALVASGTVQLGGTSGATASGSHPGLELVPCPDQGPVMGVIPQNQKVLVTARSADSGWLQLYWPAPGIERAWTRAGPLQLQGDVASLPVAACEAAPSPTPRPSDEPTPTPEATPTPTPTPGATPTPTPTAMPNAGPRLSGLAPSTASVSFDQGNYCANDPTSVTFSVSASDKDGLAGVTLFYRPPGSASFLSKAMSPSGGKYVATLNTTTDNLKTAGPLNYYVAAKDHERRPEVGAAPGLGLARDDRKGLQEHRPEDHAARRQRRPRSSPTRCRSDARGSTLSSFTAQATDPDGVKSVTLYFRKPGAGSYTRRGFTLDGTTWYSYINTVSSVDNILRAGTIDLVCRGH